MKDILSNSILSNNWHKFYKSLAVILPFIATIVIAVADYYTANNLIPTSYLPLVVGVTSVLGWVIKQPNLRGG